VTLESVSWQALRHHGGEPDELVVLAPGLPACGGVKSTGALLELDVAALKYFKNICGEITESKTGGGAGALVASSGFGAGGGAGAGVAAAAGVAPAAD
jgi:hypothetical protein